MHSIVFVWGYLHIHPCGLYNCLYLCNLCILGIRLCNYYDEMRGRYNLDNHFGSVEESAAVDRCLVVVLEHPMVVGVQGLPVWGWVVVV